jgi:uncharacterized protein YlzI (FlbEa/FlbD family)
VIALSRPNGYPILVNPDLLETAERVDDRTLVTLTTGNVLEVTDSLEAVVDAVVAYRRRIGSPSAVDAHPDR